MILYQLTSLPEGCLGCNALCIRSLMAVGVCSCQLCTAKTCRICKLVNTSRNFVSEKGIAVIRTNVSTSPNCSTIMGFNMSWKSTKSLNSFMTLITHTEVVVVRLNSSRKTHDDFGTSPRNSEYVVSLNWGASYTSVCALPSFSIVVIISVTQFTKAS